MPVVMCKTWYNEELLNRHLEAYFVFGDNMQGYGKAGQACIRDCDNSLGFPTKWAPGMGDEDFFDKTHNFFTEIVQQILPAMIEIEDMLEQKAVVVFPVDEDGVCSLGCGLSELTTRFPEIFMFICAWIEHLKEEYGERELN